METPIRKLGSSQLSVSRIGLGLAALGRPGYINLGHSEDLNRDYDRTVMERRTHQVLDKAWEMGVRYFDTARSYGLGELFLGNWLKSRSIRVEDVSIGSKWGYTYTADWKIEVEKHEIKEHTLPVLDRQWKESQETIGHYLDLYQIHSATLEGGVLTNTAVLNRLANIKAGGTLIGLSLSGHQQAEVLQEALKIKLDGQLLFDAVQATYNILETSTETILREAHHIGMGIIIKEALANGRLTSRNENPSFSSQMQILDKESKKYGVGIDALALAAVLAQPWVDIVLSGVAQERHLISNLEALNVEWNEEIAQKLSSLKEEPREYWGRRKELRWN